MKGAAETKMIGLKIVFKIDRHGSVALIEMEIEILRPLNGGWHCPSPLTLALGP